jgi:hypothetical protein
VEKENWFFEKTGKIQKPLARLTKKREKKNRLLMRGKKQGLTAGLKGMKRLIKTIWWTNYFHLLETLDKTDQIIKKAHTTQVHLLWNRLLEQSWNYRRNLISNFKAREKHLHTQMVSAMDNWDQTFKELLVPSLSLFQKGKQQGKLLILCYEAIFTPYQKQTVYKIKP